ncbi:MAG: response regulator [Lachnospiraceae bacterium]|nr:response regulator [Lachnospiraceae bacterium]
MYSYFYVAVCIITLVLTVSILIKILLSKPSVVQAVAVMFFATLIVIEIGLLLEFRSDSLPELVISFKTKYIGMAAASLILLRFVEVICGSKIPGFVYVIQAIVVIAIVALLLHMDYENYALTDWETVSGRINSLSSVEFFVLNVIFPIDLFAIFTACSAICVKAIKRYKGITKIRIVFILVVALLFVLSTISYYASDFVGVDISIYFIFAIVLSLAILLVKFDFFDSIQAAIVNVMFSGPLGIIVADQDDNIIFHNASARKMIPNIESFHRIDEDKMLEKIYKDGGGDYENENNTYTIHVDEIKEADYLVGHQFVVSDVTRLHNKMDELEQMTELANRSNETKSIFLANMSHEIRTPINAIIGMDEMILRETASDIIRDYAIDIKSASHTLLGIINDILDISKIESGTLSLVNVEYKLSQVILDVKNMTEKKAKDKGLSFSIEVDEDIPENLYGDELRIKQVMINIINNAIKYTKEGSVNINISYLKVENHERNIELVIDVSDTGIGIKEDEKNKLFTKFQRLDEIRNKNVEGTGLGLSIAKSFVTMMDGYIDVDSIYGEGTTFSIHIIQEVTDPETIGNIDDRAANNKRSDNEHIKLMAPSARILVVDDNELNLKVLLGLLKITRISIDTASSGKECIDKMKDEQYDCVLLDIMMPELNGVETLKVLKDKNIKGDVPVIALTADATAGAEDLYISLGFDDYLTKPISYSKCEDALIKYLPKNKLLNDEEIEEVLREDSNKPIVLVIDDSPDNLKMHKELLAKSYQGVFVKSKKMADKYLDTHQPDYILQKYEE